MCCHHQLPAEQRPFPTFFFYIMFLFTPYPALATAKIPLPLGILGLYYFTA